MSVEFQVVTESEKDIRLDRWFKRHYPMLSHGMLEKWLRKKNIRVDGKRAATNTRLAVGQVIRIPPMETKPTPTKEKTLSKADVSFIQKMVLYKDDKILVLNKPAGLAVQGGSKTTRHIDGMLDALKFELDERPHLVHRLDKETSGVLVVARTVQSAAVLSKLFKTKEVHKTYWALVAGLPHPEKGRIDAPLSQKRTGKNSDKRMVDEDGSPAVSLYEVQDHLADKISWLQLSPLTGRTHQLRIHTAEILKTPILGDTRYGKRNDLTKELPTKMFLHAKAISLPLQNKKTIVIEAPLPEHFKEAFKHFGFSEKNVKPLFLRSDK
ncbi:MAG: RluA family pseudouridine synthase [Alphaproteobacteria bacterium]